MCDLFFHFMLSFIRLSFVRFSRLQLNKSVVSPVFFCHEFNNVKPVKKCHPPKKLKAVEGDELISSWCGVEYKVLSLMGGQARFASTLKYVKGVPNVLPNIKKQ